MPAYPAAAHPAAASPVLSQGLENAARRCQKAWSTRERCFGSFLFFGNLGRGGPSRVTILGHSHNASLSRRHYISHSLPLPCHLISSPQAKSRVLDEGRLDCRSRNPYMPGALWNRHGRIGNALGNPALENLLPSGFGEHYHPASENTATRP